VEYVLPDDGGSGSFNSFADERPEHVVYLDAFWIDQTEVTNAQYWRCVDAGKCPEPGCWDQDNLNGPDQPVVCVNWGDAVIYAEWVGGRLPTEAEWEKACRGTREGVWPWGSILFFPPPANQCDVNCPEESFREENVDDGYAWTAPVGSFPAGVSPYGVLDMAGNVWEWTADWYDEGYYSDSPSENPRGPESGDDRVIRGGSFLGESFRCTYRDRPFLSSRNDIGFRVVVPAGE
jgi:formylglycine-generating enzyme required for sulfatase activity